MADEFDLAVAPELPASFLRSARVLPTSISDAEVILAMVNPWDDFSAKAVQLRLGRRVVRVRLEGGRFDRKFAEAFGESESQPPEAEFEANIDYSGDLDGPANSGKPARAGASYDEDSAKVGPIVETTMLVIARPAMADRRTRPT